MQGEKDIKKTIKTCVMLLIQRGDGLNQYSLSCYPIWASSYVDLGWILAA